TATADCHLHVLQLHSYFFFSFSLSLPLRDLPSFPTRRSSDLDPRWAAISGLWQFDGSSAKYLAPSSGDGMQPYGIALTNLNLTEDRKSTRLNSSHLGISYAVFCLKKKKTKSK